MQDARSDPKKNGPDFVCKCFTCFVCLLDCLFAYLLVACLLVCLLACLFACLPACVFAYLLSCLLGCLLACYLVCLRACLFVCLLACLPACLPTCLFACLFAYLLALKVLAICNLFFNLLLNQAGLVALRDKDRKGKYLELACPCSDSAAEPTELSKSLFFGYRL